MTFTTDNAAGILIALASPPTATNAGSDTPVTFAAAVRHVVIQNNTAAAVYCDFDTPATLGSFVVAAGGQMAVFDVPCTALHLYTAGAQNINGATGANIVVKGWL